MNERAGLHLSFLHLLQTLALSQIWLQTVLSPHAASVGDNGSPSFLRSIFPSSVCLTTGKPSRPLDTPQFSTQRNLINPTIIALSGSTFGSLVKRIVKFIKYFLLVCEKNTDYSDSGLYGDEGGSLLIRMHNRAWFLHLFFITAILLERDRLNQET